jgi:hypothetical protein
MPDNVRELSAADIADIFGTSSQPRTSHAPSFSGTGAESNMDIFNNPQPTPTPPVDPNNPVADIPVPEGEVPDPTKVQVPEADKPEADLFDPSAPKPEEADKPVEIKGLADYYRDRLKNGQFVGIEAEDDKGNKTQFIPQTPEEFDEVIQIQVDYKLDKMKQELQRSWYEGKSPAWQAISQYAEMVDDPTQLIPFLQGVKNIQSVQTLDEKDPEQAEAIVRTRMEQRGDPDGLIKSQIDALKSTDALLKTAQQVKPLMVQEEQRNLASQIQKAKNEEQEYLRVINDIRENAYKAIEQPLFGKTKLKQEEKATIYDLIAVPSEETQGYGIYSAIDKLFDTKDFETLKMVALLVAKKDAFFNYLGTDIANQTATKLQKKLTVAGEMRTAGKDFQSEDRPIVQRNQFNRTPKFGAGK